MIDGLEFAIPATVAPIPDVWNRLRVVPLREGAYTGMVDCRAYCGLLVFFGHRNGIRKGSEHFRLKNSYARQLTADDIFIRIRKLFPLKPKQIGGLRVVRADFAADVSPSVDWFREHFAVRSKQSSEEYVSFVQRREKETLTLVFGKDPDRYVIYNKLREMTAKGRTVLQTGVRFGTQKPVTRVERQCTGAGVPAEMRTLSSLLANAASFDPYARVEILPGLNAPETSQWTARRWLMNLGVQAAVKQYGLVGARKEANRRSKNNSALEKYMDFVRCAERGITKEQLTEVYRRSTVWRLNQPVDGVYPQGGLSLEL